MSEDVFKKLSSINVNKFVREKNGYKYLSWASALEELFNNYPNASYKVIRFDGLPYLKTDCGYFVEVEVCINDVCRSQLHPVLDYRNKPILKPNAFEINTSIQRALAKAIALHGLGLNIFTGEDLPLSEREALIDAQEELRSILKEKSIYKKDMESHLSKMDYDTLKNKINSSKEEKV